MRTCATRTPRLIPIRAARLTLADNPEDRLTLRAADQGREDFAAIRAELDFVKGQLSGPPTRAWLSRMALMGFGGV